jgi:protoporphyrinogen oxidase
MSTFDCIVVGAGASGLVAASRMARAGRATLVLEASTRVGGCIHSWRPEEGFWLELGAHTAYNSYGPLLEALADRGRLGELLRRENLAYRFCLPDGRLQSPLERLGFLEAAVSLPFGLGRPKAGRTVAEWFGGLLGKRNYRRLLAPAFAAVLSQPADNFPAEWLFRRKPRMKAAPRKFTFDGGLQGLLEALVENGPFHIRTGAPVRDIARAADGFTLMAGEEELACRQLVLAVPVDVAATLLEGAYPEAARILRSFPMSSSEAMGVVLAAEDCRLAPVAGLIGADDDFWSVVTRDPVPHDRYRGFTFHFRPGRLTRDGKIERAAAVLGVPRAAFVHVAETINRLPAPGVEHPRRAAEADALLAKEPLALVGNYLNGLSIGDCAERAALEVDRLLNL